MLTVWLSDYIRRERSSSNRGAFFYLLRRPDVGGEGLKGRGVSGAS